MAQGTADELLRKYNVQTADDLLSKYGAQPSVQPFAAPPQDFLQTKAPTERPPVPANRGAGIAESYGRIARAGGRGLLDAYSFFPAALEVASREAMRSPEGADVPEFLQGGRGWDPMFTPQNIETEKQRLGLRPGERTGSTIERMIESLAGLPLALLPMGAAAEAGLGVKAMASIAGLQQGAQGYASGYYHAKAAGASEEAATQEAFAQGAVSGITGAATAVIPAKAIGEIAKANVATGGAVIREVLGQAALGGATATGQAQASQAISRYFGTLKPEEQRTFVQSFQEEGVPAFLSQMVLQGVLSTIHAQQRAQPREAMPADTFPSPDSKRPSTVAGEQFAAGLGKTETPLLPEQAGSLQETIPLEGQPQMRPVEQPREAGAPPAVEPQYRRETAPRAVPPQAVQEPATATQAPAEAQVSSEVPAQPQAVQGGGGEPIKPETIPERIDRVFGDTKAALERVVRDEFRASAERKALSRGPVQKSVLKEIRAERKEPTYTGTKGEEGRDPVLMALRRGSKESEAIRQRHEQFHKPMYDMAREAGVTEADLGDILEVEHHAEAEALMHKRNPKVPKNEPLTGLSDFEAQTIKAKWHADPRWPKIEPIIAKYREMERSQIDRQMRSGRLPISQRRDLPYEFHAPLMSLPEEGAPRGGGGAGKVFQHQLGRRSRAENPFTMGIAQDILQTAGIESNRPRQALARFVQKTNDPNFAELIPEEDFTRRGLVKRGGEQVAGDVYDFSFPDQPDVVPVRLEGKKYAIKFGKEYQDFAEGFNRKSRPAKFNDATMQLLNASWKPGGGKVEANVLKAIPAFSRFTKQSITKYDPLWAILNFAKDAPTTILRQWSERGPIFTARLLLNTPKMAKELATNGPLAQRYRKAGGMMPTMGVEDYPTLQARIDDYIKNGDHAGAMGVFSKIANENQVGENMFRLSLFDLVTRPGEKQMSDTRGAVAAQETNVSFVRKGEIADMAEATQPFYQAGINSVRALTKTVRGKHFYQPIVAMVLGGLALDRRNRLVAGEDENGENYYDKKSDQEKNDNFLWMIPGGKGRAVKMPKPPGVGWFINVGQYLSEANWGPSDATKASRKIAGNLLANLNPVGNQVPLEGSSAQVMPAAVRPVYELRDNADYTGNEIVPQNEPGRAQKPAHERYKKNVSPIAKAATDWAAESVDTEVSPSAVEHLTRGYLPGLFQEIRRAINFGAKVADPNQDARVSDLPLMNRFVSEDNPYRTEQLFRERMELVATSVDQWKKLPPQERAAFHKAHPEIALKPMLDDYISQLREIPNDNEDAQHALKARFNRNFKARMAKSGQSVSTPPPLVETRK